MEFEKTNWYKLAVSIVALACVLALVELAHISWTGSFWGILLFMFSVMGVEVMLKALVPILVILLKPNSGPRRSDRNDPPA